MKKYTANEVMEILYSTQPMLRKFQQCWRPDSSYRDISPATIERISEKINPMFKRVSGENWDCDEIAVNGMMEVKKSLKGDREAIAFGFGMGLKWNGVEENHTANVFIYEDEAYGWDFQLEEYHKISRNDLIYFVYI